MTLFDYLTLFVLLASVIISTTRGVVREVLSLASWVAAFVVANLYGESWRSCCLIPFPAR